MQMWYGIIHSEILREMIICYNFSKIAFYCYCSSAISKNSMHLGYNLLILASMSIRHLCRENSHLEYQSKKLNKKSINALCFNV